VQNKTDTYILINMSIEKDLTNFESVPGLNDHGMMVLMGEIHADSVKPVVEWILYENYVKKKKLKELLLMICSEGGDLSVAFALIDVMRSSKIPIKTVGLGQIASCGLLIFLSGHAGRRVLTPNTSVMSHQFSWGSEGKAHELFATMKEFDLVQQRMVNLYQSTTGLDEATIRTILLPPQDVYLSAEEALRYCICDHIS
jgi:ATP-dependent Clp protease protease subunit